MAQVNILSGIYTNAASDFRVSFPRNLVPIPAPTGISNGYLRPADGIVEFGTGPGIDRGGINWNGVCYRVMGSKLVSIDSSGVVSIIGDVESGTEVSFDYSFDRLAIASNGGLYYYNSGGLTKVTDPDLGTVNDMLFVDGYFMTTDGTNLVVTELTDPTSINPLKYGSSEIDPDPVMCLLKLRGEVYALNRYTIETFQNIGGDFFPFQRVEGAVIDRGALGKKCATIFLENIAFLGGGRNEPPAVWLGANGSAINISDREVDLILKEYTETQLSTAVLEARVTDAQKLLYVHLPDQTLVYDRVASEVLGQPIWHILTSSLVGTGTYRARNFVWCYNKWLCGDPTTSKHGYVSNTISSHYGEVNGWDFSTGIIYNGSKGALFHELELVCLTGRVAVGVTPTIWTSYSVDGTSWSQEKPISVGTIGDTLRQIKWYQNGFMKKWRCQKFRGNSDSRLSIARLEMQLEALNV